ncbi:MAG: isocitrate/isopropylmalate dehydrogenase family protein, partial [Actinomycetia bacterium]|nr:isocitrate/isopropylmalate dehydrogenase family protein [Actinomycetes bacterium]
MKYRITLIPGDGTGPEITEATVKVVEATGVDIEWDKVNAGADVYEKEGTVLPQNVIDSLNKNKIGIKGPITTPVGTGFRSVNVALRKLFDLYACVRPCKSYAGVKSKYSDIDLVVIRENTEDLYAGIEFEKKDPKTLELIDFIEGIS